MPTAGVADRVVRGSLCTGEFKGAVLDSPYREWETLVFCVRLLKLDYYCVLSIQGSSASLLVYVATSEFFASFVLLDWASSLNSSSF